MTNQPNLVVFLPDQHSVTAVGAYGNDRIETPNLDAFAERSVQFENAYCTQPVCTPSRSAIMTGQYPHTTGLTENNTPLPADARCLPELGAFDDYATAFMGKWDLGDEIFAQHGFDEWIGIEDGYRDQYTRGDPDERSAYHRFLRNNGFEPDDEDGSFSRGFAAGLPEEYTKTAFIADEAIQFIEKHQNDPFILYVAPLWPHSPYTGPRDDQYDPADVPLPPNFDHDGFDEQPLKYKLFRESDRRDEDTWRELISNYWGLASLVDTHVGRVLDALAENDLSEDTVTAYTSDHGCMMGNHGIVGKNVMFEEATRVPFLLHLPDNNYNKMTVEHPVSQIDLVPTLLDALGQPQPDHLHGHSLLPFLAGEITDPVEPNVFIEENGPDGNGIDRRKDRWPGVGSRPQLDPNLVAAAGDIATEDEMLRAYLEPIRTVITPDGWKLNYHCDGGHELYDLSSDPAETKNLADDPEHEDTIEELFGEILNWQVRTRDPIYLQ